MKKLRRNIQAPKLEWLVYLPSRKAAHKISNFKDHIANFFQFSAQKKNKERPNPQFYERKLQYFFTFLFENAKTKSKEAET